MPQMKTAVFIVLSLLSTMAFSATNSTDSFVFASGARAVYNPYELTFSVTDVKGATYLYTGGDQSLRLLTTDRYQLDLRASHKEQAAFARYIVTAAKSSQIAQANAAAFANDPHETHFIPGLDTDDQSKIPDFLRIHQQFGATYCPSTKTCVQVFGGVKDDITAGELDGNYRAEFDNDNAGVQILLKF